MTTSGAALKGLPHELHAALEAEIDPGEELRWCGRPDPDRVMRKLLPGVISFSIILILFGGMGLSAAWEAWSELLDAASVSAQGAKQWSWIGLIFMGTFGVGACAAGLVGAPRLLMGARRSAARTAYAVTSSRVLSVQLGRRGVPRVTSVEPAHPLVITRSDAQQGQGDIHLYPDRSRQHQGAISFIGVEDARAVERLIRSTFDPPGR